MSVVLECCGAELVNKFEFRKSFSFEAVVQKAVKIQKYGHGNRTAHRNLNRLRKV